MFLLVTSLGMLPLTEDLAFCPLLSCLQINGTASKCHVKKYQFLNLIQKYISNGNIADILAVREEIHENLHMSSE